MAAILETVRNHWPEYLMEAAGLGLFMMSAAVITTLLEYPASPLHEAVPDPTIRRVLIGVGAISYRSRTGCACRLFKRDPLRR